MVINSCKSIVIILLFFLVSCAHSPDIIGHWQEPGTTSSLEFRHDGTFTAIDDMGMAVKGRYILQEDGTIRLEIKHQDSSAELITGDIVVQGDTLTLAHGENKEVLTYKKIRK